MSRNRFLSLTGKGLGHPKTGWLPRGIPAETDNPQPWSVLGNSVMGSVEDAPRDMIMHGLKLLNPGAPPGATRIRCHPVALLHEKSHRPAAFDRTQNLVQKGGAVVALAQLLAATGPSMAGKDGQQCRSAWAAPGAPWP